MSWKQRQAKCHFGSCDRLISSCNPCHSQYFLKHPCLHEITGFPGNYNKYIEIHGLNILKQSKAYFYFRPAPNYRNILIAGTTHFHTVIRLRLTTTACCQPLRIPKGTHLGTLHPMLQTKYVEKQ